MDSTALAPTGHSTLTLADLAGKINAAHVNAERCFKAGLKFALEASQLLIEAKGLCQHGEWLTWVQQKCAFSERTTQTYIRVAERWPEIAANAQSSADLSLDRAIKLLAAPRSDPDDPEPAESPETSANAAQERLAFPNCGCDEVDEDGDVVCDKSDVLAFHRTRRSAREGGDDDHHAAKPKPKYPLSISFEQVLSDIVAALNLVREDHKTITAMMQDKRWGPDANQTVSQMIHSLRQTFTEWDEAIRGE